MTSGTGTTRLAKIAQACVAGIALGFLLYGFFSEFCYSKDLQEEYLKAMALRDDVDLSTPLDELSARYFPEPNRSFPHPGAHPPFLALVFYPATVLSFPAVVFLWLILNFGLLVVIGRWLRFSLQGTLSLAAWPPLLYVLFCGNLELLILFFAMLGWRSAADGRDVMGGTWLGTAAAIKLYPIVLLVPFLVRRRVRVLVAAGFVLGLSQLGNIAAVGGAGVVRYYSKVMPGVVEKYSSLGLNSSPHGALLRIFGGAADAGPILNAPGVVIPITIVIAVLALWALAKLEPEDAVIPMMVALPVVWFTYATLALPQIVALLRSNISRNAVLLATAAVSFTLPIVNLLLMGPMKYFFRWSGGGYQAMAVLLTSIQTAGYIALLVLSLARSSKTPDPVPQEG